MKCCQPDALVQDVKLEEVWLEHDQEKPDGVHHSEVARLDAPAMRVGGAVGRVDALLLRLEYPPQAHPPLPLIFRRTSLSTSDRTRSHSSPCTPRGHVEPLAPRFWHISATPGP